MFGYESQTAYSASLKPPEGDPLELQSGTWIGRGSFEASTRAQLLCSRRQACFTFTNTGLRIECHGINPLAFVVCHSRGVHGTEATPGIAPFQLRKGEAVDLTDGDQFYFAGMECLLTVVLRQNDARDLVQQASEACMGEIEVDLVGDELQFSEIPRAVEAPAEDCDTGAPQSLTLEDAAEAAGASHCPDVAGPQENLAASVSPVNGCSVSRSSEAALPCDAPRSSEAAGASHCPDVAGPQEIFAAFVSPVNGCSASRSSEAVLPCDAPRSSKAAGASHCPDVAGPQEFFAAFVSPVNGSPVSGMCRYESLRNGQEYSDSLALAAYDCLPVVAGSRLGVQRPLRCSSPEKKEEVSNLVAAVDDVNRNSIQSAAENTVEEAPLDSTVNEVPEDGSSARLSVGAEGFRSPCAREDQQAVETNSRDLSHGSDEVDEDLPNEACGQNEQREPEDYNLLMSSETVDGQSIEDESLPSEPARGLAVEDIRECLEELPNMEIGRAANKIFPVTVEVDERIESLGSVNPEVPAAAEDVSWPDGPVEGMESVIVSVSGYEGTERQNLVKLINKTGAAYTGQLSKANTHLVCWKFHGKKFDRAMKLHKPVVNHQWLEDCLLAGRKLPEGLYKLRSGEDVGLLKWKETPPPLLIERDEPVDGVINQQRVDHGTHFLDTIDDEWHDADERGQGVVSVTASHRRDLSDQPRQAAVTNVESGRTGDRKKSRRLVKVGVEQEQIPTATATGIGEPQQRRACETLNASEEAHNTRRRKSDSSASLDAGQAQGHDMKRRKSASSLSDWCDDEQGRGTVVYSRRGRSRPSAGPDRECTVINLCDDVDEDARETDLHMPQAGSAPASQGTGADINKGKEPECSQLSQSDREVACAICLVDKTSSSQGLLGCGHKFCYKCIFTWTLQPVKGCPSCPLCKNTYDFITRQEVDISGKLDETVVIVGKKEQGSSSGSHRTIVLEAVCIQCGNNDAESLLMRCGSCGNRAIHTFCMDPPAPPPWFCTACTQGHQRDSLRLAWNHFLPGPSTSEPEMRPVTSGVRRRNTQPYTFRRPSRPVSAYRPHLYNELTQNMGPPRRTNVVGQHSLRTWLNETSNGDT